MPFREMMGSLSQQVTAIASVCTYVLTPTTHFHTSCPPIVGKIYLVDAGYACRTGFLPPYRGVRYHLSEFSNRNYPTNGKELFNLRHSSLRVVVERAWGALKGRFRIVDNKSFHKYKTQVKLVLACCILHNWILGFGIDEIVPPEEGFEGEVPEDDEGEVPLEEPAMVTIRDQIANAMWEARGTHRT
jgi:hypothetical protein